MKHLLTILLMLLPLNVFAQIEENVADSLITDSIATDSTLLSIPYPLRAQQQLAMLVEDSMFQTSQMGLMVYDLDADSVLFVHNHRQMMRPASTMKLLTAITALDRLGTKHRFRTSLYYQGERDSTNLYGNIYIKGRMDPTFDSYDMDCFVEAIAQLHIDTIRGSLIADRSFKDDKLLGEGWCWDDKNPVLSPLLYKRKDSFRTTLRERLESLGIIVLGNDSTASVPSDAELLTERFTPIENVLYKMMKDSDNLYAESMLYQIASSTPKTATAKGAQQYEKEVLKRSGITSDYRLADGSGLSLYNYLTPEAEVMILRYAYHNKNIFGALCQSLPRAGVDGTLKKRMHQEPVKDNVRAKTGTLTGISSLAGYCTSPEGHMLAFCIINQGIMSSNKAKHFQDKVCMALCQ